MPTLTLRSLVLTTLLAPLSAQVVHYPDNVHAQAPANISFPLYTPGGGVTGLPVRAQFLCPDTFLSTQGLSAGYVTKVGLSLGGAALYDVFEIRAGVAGVTTLGPSWAANLPDQRIQHDQSGETVVGGGTAAAPVNEWIDFELNYPFHYQPGDALVFDLTAKIGVVDEYLTTSPANGQVERAYNFTYVPGAPATDFNFNGIKLRFTFAPAGLVEFGNGCAEAGGVAPDLGLIGAPQLGLPIVYTADQATANGLGVFVFGLSRTEYLGAPLPAQLGGGCALLVSADVMVPEVLSASGQAAYQFQVPAGAGIAGATLFCQFAQFQSNSPASVPFTLSEAGAVTFF